MARDKTLKAKRCPVCGGKPKWKYYALPQFKYPDAWDFGEFGLEPVCLMKSIECEDCGTETRQLSISLDEAIMMWNDGNVFEFISREYVKDLEDPEDE